jgi:predicted RNase H-like nuclease (RuvC/YqgF family)
MKMKDLRKRIRQLEKRLGEGSQKLAELKRSLEAAEAVKALKGAKKSFACAAAARIAEARKLAVRKAKRKLNLSPERRAELAAAMKARWAAKRADANAVKRVGP